MASLPPLQHDLTENELRALAALKFFGGFNPEGGRIALVTALAAKGMATEWDTLTPAGEALLKAIYNRAAINHQRTPFEQELVDRMGRQLKREWDEAERALPNTPPPANRSDWN